MAYACDICGKSKQYGHNVSFSQRKTQKVWKPNLQRQYIVLGGSRIQAKICTQCIRTLDKYRKIEDAKAQAAELKAETAKQAKAEAKADSVPATTSDAKKPAAKPRAKKTPAAAAKK